VVVSTVPLTCAIELGQRVTKSEVTKRKAVDDMTTEELRERRYLGEECPFRSIEPPYLRHDQEWLLTEG
jgi:hypothetical protein